ncbi:hypothetical protein QP027_02185 [Corynebacterium breve]|uniref:Secreted protein n=1 Tax=Corynebacterium breve TaxID=3049799 RepID=A0ABY8VFX1_9CORY|nr:hypothetical protein [Corynebacterium breve]WIM68232.1 hypothetical protein QP027_02185 [Corynebacterium breve]
MRRHTLRLVIAVSCLALSACSSANTSSAPVTVTSTVVATSEASQDPETPTIEEETPTEETQAAPVVEPVDISQHSINAGQVGGNCGTTSQGDSIRANDSTSCEFAAAIFNSAISAQYTTVTTNPSVTALPRAQITAYSPVTQQAYNLECYVNSAGQTLTCYDPGNDGRGASFSTERMGYHGRLNLIE